MSAGRHCLCGKPICRQNRTGRCRSCGQLAVTTPALVARRAASLRRRLATDAGLRARYTAQVTANHAGAANEYRLRRLRAAKQPDWVPVEYRSLFSELRRSGLSHDEIRAAIDTHIATAARAFARTGRLPSMEATA